MFKRTKKHSFKKLTLLGNIATLLASVLYFNSCNSVDPDAKAVDKMSGIYYMHGTKIITIYPCTFTCFDMEPYVETTTVAFTMNMEPVDGKRDTIRFFGLMGADAGESGTRGFREFLFPIELFYSEEFKVYAHLTGSTFEIDLATAGPQYTATGILQNNAIQLSGQYHYRQRTFAYELEGVKIERP